ncbi:hypothetical protein D3C72_1409170 [compost metagenome]
MGLRLLAGGGRGAGRLDGAAGGRLAGGDQGEAEAAREDAAMKLKTTHNQSSRLA